jgi:methionine aminopeptidase
MIVHGAEPEPENDASHHDAIGAVPLGARDPETGKLVFSIQRTLPTAIPVVKVGASVRYVAADLYAAVQHMRIYPKQGSPT